jgi:hypothetical protein
MFESTAPGIPYDIWGRVQTLVTSEVVANYGVIEPKINVLWFAWFDGEAFTAVPSKDWRALVVSSGLPYGVYFQVSYDSISNAYYIDRYTREDQTVVSGV